MLQLILITFKGIFRDRVFKGIAICALFFLLIPAVSSLSMRQVMELSITLSLSLISMVMLLLSVFLGGSSLWKDMERRYTYGILGLPITRTSYLLGKFFGIATYLFLTTLVLGAVGCVVIKYVSITYPPMRPVVWLNVFLSIFFIALKYILLVDFAFLLSTVSTSFFLPIFGTSAVFFVGSATQQVYDFLHSSSAQAYSPFIKKLVNGLYYILPNFSAFDLSVNAIYGIGLSVPGLLLTTGYFVIYTAVVLTVSAIVFSQREMQ
jgi:Cu-processing system permease protein